MIMKGRNFWAYIIKWRRRHLSDNQFMLLISLLVGMAPARLEVYDLSNGARQELVEALTGIFSGRICLYTGEFT